MYDKKVVRNTLLVFDQSLIVVMEEVLVKGSINGMPHGKIDLLVGRQVCKPPLLLCMLSSGFTSVYEVSSATVKAPVTLSKLASGKL